MITKGNINSRIKNLRKESGLNQKEFAKKIGLTQTGVSHIEQNGHNVSDSTIKAICYEFKINEIWLRKGIEPMLVQPDTFSLDSFVKDRGMSDLELRILKRYFALDPKTRQDALSYFLSGLETEVQQETVRRMPQSEEELLAESTIEPADKAI